MNGIYLLHMLCKFLVSSHSVPRHGVVCLCFLNTRQIIDTGHQTDSLWPGSGSPILSYLQQHKHNKIGLGPQEALSQQQVDNCDLHLDTNQFCSNCESRISRILNIISVNSRQFRMKTLFIAFHFLKVTLIKLVYIP